MEHGLDAFLIFDLRLLCLDCRRVEQLQLVGRAIAWAGTMQNLLTRSFYERAFSTLKTGAIQKRDRTAAARLNGARAPKSADWLKATPSRDTVLADNQFGTAFRFRFGLPPLPAEQMPATVSIACISSARLQRNATTPFFTSWRAGSRTLVASRRLSSRRRSAPIVRSALALISTP